MATLMLGVRERTEVRIVPGFSGSRLEGSPVNPNQECVKNL